ncbi:MAG: HAD family hydrolase, partial [Proteobacteria bacterium]|nr:HAD family hydrolase [Pseudomonadota bacterium]
MKKKPTWRSEALNMVAAAIIALLVWAYANDRTREAASVSGTLRLSPSDPRVQFVEPATAVTLAVEVRGSRRAIETFEDAVRTGLSLSIGTDGLSADNGSHVVSLKDVLASNPTVAASGAEVVRVRPGENLPADGRVLRGQTSINQASLTGEAVPVEAAAGTMVYAGTSNLTGQIDVEVNAIASESTIGKVEKLIREAESARTQRQELIERLAGAYVPVVLMVAALVWFFTSKSDVAAIRDQAAERAITVLVVTCPGALLIAYPTAMVAAFAAAARLGIMVKTTRTLESAAHIDTVIMDKTGTLTTGKFSVSRLAPAEGVDAAVLLQAATDAEQSSNHPLARSILETAEKARLTPRAISDYQELHGRGVAAKSPDGVVRAGRAQWLMELQPGIAAEVEKASARIDGMSGVHVMVGDRYLGAVGLEDKLRRNAA